MDLSIYQVIRGPVLSNKALKLNKVLNKLVLDVHPKATRSQIKYALMKVFNIQKIEKINIISRKGKNKRVGGGRSVTRSAMRKRAIITLRDAHPAALNHMQIAAPAV